MFRSIGENIVQQFFFSLALSKHECNRERAQDSRFESTCYNLITSQYDFWYTHLRYDWQDNMLKGLSHTISNSSSCFCVVDCGFLPLFLSFFFRWLQTLRSIKYRYNKALCLHGGEVKWKQDQNYAFTFKKCVFDVEAKEMEKDEKKMLIQFWA